MVELQSPVDDTDDGYQKYRQGWQAVHEVEQRELATLTVEQRWNQLNALFRLAQDLELVIERDEQQEWLVVQRWVELKDYPIEQGMDR